jgi:TonB family protein
MNFCPNCRENLGANLAVCVCNQLVGGDVTQANLLKTQAVIIPRALRQTVNPHRIAVVSVVLTVAATILVAAWPQIRETLPSVEGPAARFRNSSFTQNPTRSDIVPDEDITKSESVLIAGSRQGIFDLSANIGQKLNTYLDPDKTDLPNVQQPVESEAPRSASLNAYDAQLLSEQTQTEPAPKESNTTLSAIQPTPNYLPESTGSGVLPETQNTLRSTTLAPEDEAPPKPVIRRSLGVVNSIALSLPKPNYPSAAYATNAQGKVDVQVTIDETGRVISAKAINGSGALRSVSEQAAKRARFRPTTLSNVPMKVTGVITYNFTRN